jgi:hypothetical protein
MLLVFTAVHAETVFLHCDVVVLQENAASTFRFEGGTYKTVQWYSIYLHNYVEE